MGLMMFMVIFLVASWPFIGYVENNNIQIIFSFIWICSMFLFYSGLFSILPSYISHTWGTTKTGVILGYIFLSAIPGNIIVAQFIIWMKNVSNWYILCYTMSLFGFIALCLVLTINCNCYCCRNR